MGLPPLEVPLPTPFGASKYHKDELTMAWTFYNASGESMVTHAESEATQAEMEAETAVAHFVPPDLVKNSPGVAKAWIQIPANGVITPAAANSFNVASVTDTGTGDRTIVIATDFDNTTYAAIAQLSEHRSALFGVMCHSHAAGNVSLEIYDESDSKSDQLVDVCMFGLQV
jgi:hypothetical protein